MKIKNRIAGEWKLFSEGTPPEKGGTFLLCGKVLEYGEWHFPDIWVCEDKPNTWHLYGSLSFYLTTEDLVKNYDTYCVIQGPWEDKDADL